MQAASLEFPGELDYAQGANGAAQVGANDANVHGANVHGANVHGANVHGASAHGASAHGAWLLSNVVSMEAAVARARARGAKQLDAASVTQLDTAGALLWAKQFDVVRGLDAEHQSLFDLVRGTLHAEPVAAPPNHSILAVLERMGRAVNLAIAQLSLLLDFTGRTLWSFGQIIRGKRKLRMTAVFHHMERTGLDAVPIVALLCFLVGAVVAYLGATVLKDFGAALYTVELVNFSFQREFGVLLTAIIVAGRSGSAFTAELGTMRAREEIDAIASLGLDPMELLVVPRVTALLLMLPALTFIGMLSGIVGGALVGSAELDISTAMFITRMRDVSEARHFFVGMGKAPVFAMLIAVVGCLEGMKVRGSAESVGRHTTSSVVQGIFLVILFDALFAIFFMKLGL